MPSSPSGLISKVKEGVLVRILSNADVCVLQNVYELFLKFLEMREFDVPTAKTCLDSKFVENVRLDLHVTCMHSIPHLSHHTCRC